MSRSESSTGSLKSAVKGLVLLAVLGLAVYLARRYGVGDMLAGLCVTHLIELLEPLHDVAAAELFVRRVRGAVAIDARARLGSGLLAARVGLVDQHIGVAPFLAEIHREGVARPHPLHARVRLDLALGHLGPRVHLGGRLDGGFAAAVAGARHVDGFLIGFILKGCLYVSAARQAAC